MPKHPRKLLVAATLCVMPFLAPHAPAAAEPVWDSSDCPYARARAAAALAATERREAALTARWTDGSSASVSIFNISRDAPGLVP